MSYTARLIALLANRPSRYSLSTFIIFPLFYSIIYSLVLVQMFIFSDYSADATINVTPCSIAISICQCLPLARMRGCLATMKWLGVYTEWMLVYVGRLC